MEPFLAQARASFVGHTCPLLFTGHVRIPSAKCSHSLSQSDCGVRERSSYYETGGPVKLWLDDMRDPACYDHEGWTWVENAEAAKAAFRTGKVTKASLDHDLTPEHMMGNWADQATGYDVLVWLEQNPGFWPIYGIEIHSINPSGRARMQAILDRVILP
jgi:hypothetical protein